jgi:preprotein translocase subunit SecF
VKKRRLHHFWRRFRQVKPWYFLALAIISTVVCVYALRANNEHMVKLRSQVYTADKNNGDISGALSNLQSYVTAHMNTNLSTGVTAVYPPIQLKYTYSRLVNAESQSLAAQNSSLYTQAESYCQTEVPNGFSGRYRVPCIEQYVSSHSLQKVSINQSLYEFDFISPTWSPDLAGWSMLVAIIFGALFIISFVANWLFKKFVA